MKKKKIKILVDGKIASAKIENDFHYLGGKKVVYVLPNNVTGNTSLELTKIVEDEKVN
jgi:hypothetical protein